MSRCADGSRTDISPGTLFEMTQTNVCLGVSFADDLLDGSPAHSHEDASRVSLDAPAVAEVRFKCDNNHCDFVGTNEELSLHLSTCPRA